MADTPTVITQKKKKLTLKSQAVETPAPDIQEQAQATGRAGIKAQTVSPTSYTWAAILALVAVLAFVALLVMQWMEWRYYHNEPPIAFPLRQAIGNMPAMPAHQSAPAHEPVSE